MVSRNLEGDGHEIFLANDVGIMKTTNKDSVMIASPDRYHYNKLLGYIVLCKDHFSD